MIEHVCGNVHVWSIPVVDCGSLRISWLATLACGDWSSFYDETYNGQIDPNATVCQIHYPASKSSSGSNSDSTTSYFRPNAVEGVADYGGTNVALLNFLSDRKHPCEIKLTPTH